MSKLDRNLAVARAAAEAGNLQTALEAVTQALVAAPGDRNLSLFRARLLHALGRPRDALVDLAKLPHEQASPAILSFRADVEEAAGDVGGAIRSVSEILKQGVSTPALFVRRALLHQAAGDFDKARHDLERAIAQQPQNGELYRLLSGLITFEADDPLIDRMWRLKAELREEDPGQPQLDFALSKALDDIDDVEGSFSHLMAANTAMRRAAPYDISTRLHAVAQIKRSFAKFDPKSFQHPEASTAAPIFVTGLPRAGTTLVEQIISAHETVLGGGETAVFGQKMRRTIGDPSSGQPQFSSELMALLGHAYVAALPRLEGSKTRHTDKSIQSLIYAPAILAALPQARLVVVRRDPRANALSLLRQVFRPGKQLFSYDLADIYAYQQSYEEMLAHWQQHVPLPVSVVQYEDLVARPDEEIRHLLTTNGLDWDPACLTPEKNPRIVRTLSATSVRQPINTRSSEAWRRYAHLLEPMMAEHF